MAFETNSATSAVVNPNILFGHIQQSKRLKNQIVTLKNEDGLRVTNPSSQADLVADTHFDLTLSHQFLSSSRKPNQCLQWCLLLIP